MGIKVLSRQRFGRQSPVGEQLNHLLVCLFLHLLGNWFGNLYTRQQKIQLLQSLLSIKVFTALYFAVGHFWFICRNKYITVWEVFSSSIPNSTFFWHFTGVLACSLCFLFLTSPKLSCSGVASCWFCCFVLGYSVELRQCFAAIFVLFLALFLHLYFIFIE